jgi:4'-phosphopantetheinyl transferase
MSLADAPVFSRPARSGGCTPDARFGRAPVGPAAVAVADPFIRPHAAECRVEPGAIHLWYVPMKASPDLVRALEPTLDVRETAQAARFRLPGLARKYTIAHGLLRAALGAYLRVSAGSIEISRQTNGKPFVAGAGLGFNASDSDELLILGFAPDAELGVDVEHIRPLPDALDIARRFFHPAEYQQLLAFPEEQRTQAFFRCWTMKEAYLKATGEGLMSPLDGFRVDLERAACVPEICAGEAAARDSWTIATVMADPSYSVAVALPRGHWQVRYWRFRDAGDCIGFCAAVSQHRLRES